MGKSKNMRAPDARAAYHRVMARPVIAFFAGECQNIRQLTQQRRFCRFGGAIVLPPAAGRGGTLHCALTPEVKTGMPGPLSESETVCMVLSLLPNPPSSKADVIEPSAAGVSGYGWPGRHRRKGGLPASVFGEMPDRTLPAV